MTSNGRVTGELRSGEDLQRISHVLVVVLRRNFPGGNGDNHEKYLKSG
jgi:hypothetical protein